MALDSGYWESAEDINVPSKWIPVTERLPGEEDADELNLVLIYTKNDENLIVDYKDVWRFREFITHWMPLPEPPKDAE